MNKMHAFGLTLLLLSTTVAHVQANKLVSRTQMGVGIASSALTARKLVLNAQTTDAENNLRGITQHLHAALACATETDNTPMVLARIGKCILECGELEDSSSSRISNKYWDNSVLIKTEGIQAAYGIIKEIINAIGNKAIKKKVSTRIIRRLLRVGTHVAADAASMFLVMLIYRSYHKNLGAKKPTWSTTGEECAEAAWKTLLTKLLQEIAGEIIAKATIDQENVFEKALSAA